MARIHQLNPLRLIGSGALAALSACQSPIVQTRDYIFAATYSQDGREVSVSRTYRCFLESPAMLSEGGPNWRTRSHDAQTIRLELSSGQAALIEPLPRVPRPGQECPETVSAVPSAILIALANDDGLIGFDGWNTDYNGRTVRLLSAEAKPLASGHAPFKSEASTPDPRKFYYTFSGAFFRGSEIDRMGLRAYVSSRPDIWLTPGRTWRFEKWTSEDVQVARTINKPALYYPQDGLGTPATWSSGGWTLSDPPSHAAMSWLHLADPVGATPDASLPKALVRYKGFEFELPTEKYSGFHFYDPKADELIVVYRVQLQALAP